MAHPKVNMSVHAIEVDPIAVELAGIESSNYNDHGSPKNINREERESDCGVPMPNIAPADFCTQV